MHRCSFNLPNWKLISVCLFELHLFVTFSFGLWSRSLRGYKNETDFFIPNSNPETFARVKCETWCVIFLPLHGLIPPVPQRFKRLRCLTHWWTSVLKRAALFDESATGTGSHGGTYGVTPPPLFSAYLTTRVKPYLTVNTMDFLWCWGGTLQILDSIWSDRKSDERTKGRMMSSESLNRIGL